jgi:hypothetical protein
MGWRKLMEPSLAEDSGAVPPKRNFGKIYLVKYCNFIVNLDRLALGENFLENLPCKIL